MEEDMSRIQQLAKQALKTFRHLGSQPTKQNIEKLNNLMSSITAQDVNLHDPTKDRRKSLPGAPPVTHVNLLECPYFSMGIFIVRQGESLPLHDHIGMYGMCKVLYGTIQVTMYDRYNSKDDDDQSDTINGLRKCYFNNEFTLGSNDGTCVVTPTRGNYHTIKAVGRSAAFLDILSPPYSSDDGRDCFYYKECKSRQMTLPKDSNLRYLLQIACPSEFFCDSKPYTGPKINLTELLEACDQD